MTWGAFLTAAVVAAGQAGTVSTDTSVWVTREFRAMGTELRIEVAAATREAAIAASEAAFGAIRATDALVSSWRTDSEVGRLNAAPVPTPVHAPRLVPVIAEVAQWVSATDGAFDPVVGALIDAWDLRGAGRTAAPSEIDAALQRTGLRHLHFDQAAGTLWWSADGAWVDAGGFGKGLALRAAARALDAHAVHAARIDFGGQLLAVGSSDRDPWRVTVAHPERRGEAVATLTLQQTSVATSGQSERGVDATGRRVGHILDPRTGQPVDPWGSVTVVAPDPMTADILATALFVMGPDAAARWAHTQPDIGVLVLQTTNGAVVQQQNHFMERLLLSQRSHE